VKPNQIPIRDLSPGKFPHLDQAAGLKPDTARDRLSGAWLQTLLHNLDQDCFASNNYPKQQAAPKHQGKLLFSRQRNQR
jgi:hypothetical protein